MPVAYAKRGRGNAGTYAHPILAASYAGYLSDDPLLRSTRNRAFSIPQAHLHIMQVTERAPDTLHCCEHERSTERRSRRCGPNTLRNFRSISGAPAGEILPKMDSMNRPGPSSGHPMILMTVISMPADTPNDSKYRSASTLGESPSMAGSILVIITSISRAIHETVSSMSSAEQHRLSWPIPKIAPWGGASCGSRYWKRLPVWLRLYLIAVFR